MTKIILASSSPYRRALLEKAGFKFEYHAPNIDESAHPNEQPTDLVKRLSLQKTQALANDYPNAYIIGSDQVLSLADEALGKPGNYENAFSQLSRCAGQTAILHTGIAIIHPARKLLYVDVDYYHVTYRNFSDKQIEKYLKSEEPYDCCGSLKAEASGIRLLQSLNGNDPNTLIGLPIIKIIDFLSSNDEEY